MTAAARRHALAVGALALLIAATGAGIYWVQSRTAPSAVPATTSAAEPVRAGGKIRTPTRLKCVPPRYPPIAESARVSGVVIVDVTVGTDGRVEDAKVSRSIPLLDQAALDAVKQWLFTPTLVQGVPARVVFAVAVNFTLP